MYKKCKVVLLKPYGTKSQLIKINNLYYTPLDYKDSKSPLDYINQCLYILSEEKVKVDNCDKLIIATTDYYLRQEGVPGISYKFIHDYIDNNIEEVFVEFDKDFPKIKDDKIIVKTEYYDTKYKCIDIKDINFLE